MVQATTRPPSRLPHSQPTGSVITAKTPESERTASFDCPNKAIQKWRR